MAMQPTRLRVEYGGVDTPVDDLAPRFSWALQPTPGAPARGEVQKAYRIVVSEYLSGSTVWDSGTVASNRTVNIRSAPSKPLVPDSDYAYTVTTTDGAGATASASSWFSTSLINATAAFQGADWMSPPEQGTSPSAKRLFRCPFELPFRPVRARLYVATGNYFKASINGQRVSQHELGTFTTFQQRVLYAAVNVTDAADSGANVLGLSLGNGWYSQDSIKAGPVTFKALLTAVGPDGQTATLRATAASGGPMSCLAGPSPVVFDDIYIGEVFDARIEEPGWDAPGFAPSAAWAAPITSDGGAAGAAALNVWRLPVAVDEVFTPVSVTEPLPGAFVVDFGQNMAGAVTLTLPADTEPGTAVSLQHAEILNPDGTAHDVYRNAPMQANYTARGGGETYSVQFSYMGFRYVQVTGFPGTPSRASMSARFIHSAVGRTGSFSSSNALLNSVVDITRYASLSNLMDVPTDCPQRERRGWMGDAQLSCEVVLTNFDASLLYPKFITDIADAQTYLAAKGALPDCVPWYHHGGLPADPAWGVAGALIPRWTADYLDDDDLRVSAYPMVKGYVESELARTSGGLLTASRYGDWCSVAGGISDGCPHPSGVVSTYYLIEALDTAAEFAAAAGDDAGVARYTGLAKSTRAAFVAANYHESSSSFGEGHQVDLLAALSAGLEGHLSAGQLDGLRKTLVALFTNTSVFPNHPSGGIVYTKLLWPVLDAAGRSDLGLTAMLAGPSKPGFSEMINQTATTLWESWDMDEFNGGASRNHIMFGGGSGLWPFQTVAGIRRAGPSWSSLRIAPAVPQLADRVDWATASIDTAIGLVESSWTAGGAGSNASGTCAAQVAENTVAHFQCLGPGGAAPGPENRFTAVEFASFGLPTGTCSAGFAHNPACDANTTTSIVETACVGHGNCSIDVSDKTFGDPCYEVVKHFSAKLRGNCSEIRMSMAATVPPNGNAVVVVPVGNAATAFITEGGRPVWKAGAYVPGVPGVSGAAATASGAVEVQVGSGTFSFVAEGMAL